MAAFYRELFRDEKGGTRGAACLDAEGRLINTIILGEPGDFTGALRKAVRAALRHCAFSVVIVQYAPDEKNDFSPGDIAFARMFADAMAALSIATLDFVLVYENGRASMRERDMLRETALAPGEETELSLRWLDN
jgi:DNA repair protein RadC